ncbi:MAG: hypothetical protein ACKOCN_00310, partial [Planctomycetaceae bacterium]
FNPPAAFRAAAVTLERSVSYSVIAVRHLRQYHGAECFTGFGLRFRHFAQRYRLPFTLVLGRSRLPVRGMFFGMDFRGYRR